MFLALNNNQGRKELIMKNPDYPLGLTLVFMWVTVLYVTIIGNAFDVGENNRFRFTINLFTVIIFALFLQKAVGYFRNTVNRLWHTNIDNQAIQ